MTSWKSPAKKKRKLSSAPERGPAPATDFPADLTTPPTAAEVPLLVAARQSALGALGFELQAAQMVEAARRASALADSARLRVVQPKNDAIACRKGCSWCCNLKVGVTVAEVIAITTHLQAFPEQRARVQKKAAELAKDPRVLSDTEKPRARLACALLAEDGSCGVYEVRPLPCRSWLSTDERSCVQHLDALATPKFVAGAARSGRFVQLGLAKAMDDVKRYPYLVELTSALDIALNEPNAVERWLAGEPVFARASAARAETVQ